jgi:hypothetical protein
MKCGHAANATDENGNPVCGICISFTKDARQIESKLPDLKGRKAKCDYCKRIKESSFDLPFFEHKPNDKYDSYYCGCRGWD